MKKLLLSAAALALLFTQGPLLFQPTGAMAQTDGCTFTKSQDDFEQTDIDKLYDCIKDDLAKGYGQAGHEIGANFRNWKATQTAIGPSFAGHGDRFLKTYANDIAFDDYIQFRDEGGFSMPVGSILAKESWKINKEGVPTPGPLLIMTKLKAGEASEFGDWLYAGVSPGSGKEFR